ncbi:RNA polymerase II-associated protein 3-like isoform X10 [Camellia sinensis]|uniref:RNA polymerase II-associated protein 3-like isoform X10 n=1 Tax=Camellia sinensis TaxID=4442 RepID=UPI001035F4D1|nr:RNA polymerase II-associated protein 3-like isoform X10 [Camellia sinensis]
MARAPSKHGRDQSLDFQGFLNKLQDWEMSPSDRDKKLKPQGLGKENLVSSSQKIGVVGEDRRPRTKAPASDNPSTARQYDHLRNYDSIRNLSSGFMTEESSPDAASEKELGNEFFKQKKFKEAIDCYSRGIALSPTAVAYANRGMAYLKIRRFQEAEDDCTEALNLDDRYIKAYSRRSTARKELGKLKESMEDAEFAMRLEPLNQEIKKQYAEAKSLYEKDSDGQVPARTPMSVVEAESKSKRGKGREADASSDDAMQSSGLESSKRNHKKQELKASVQELAAQAASLAKIEAAKNITPPNSAYQFEVSWRGLAGDHTLQARLLKVTSPVALPQIFKNALSAPILIEIIRCIVTFFCEEMDLAVKYLENLAKVSRFDMIIMCLSSTDKTDLHKIWDDIFCSNATPMEYAERLDKLQSRYCPKQ